MGDKVNTMPLNIFGWVTVLAIFGASAGLIVTWFL